MKKRIDNTKGWPFLSYALMAFACLGIELLLAFVLEPLLYGRSMNEWSDLQNISHWVLTCICWGLVIFFLIRSARSELGYDVLARGSRMKAWQWAVVAFLFVLMLVYSWYDWNGSKVIKEFRYNGWLKFIFQYIYYAFEVGLVLLIISFGQKAFENWFHHGTAVLIPYGGIVAGLTWGLAHTFTKGSLLTGLALLAVSVFYGLTWLLTNRDYSKAYPILFLMFVL